MPAACAGASACPLVFCLHDAGRSPAADCGPVSRALRDGGHGAIGVYPQGEGEWNAMGEPDHAGRHDDVAFLLAVANDLAERGAVGDRFVSAPWARASRSPRRRARAEGRRYGLGSGAALAQRVGLNSYLGFRGVAAFGAQLLSEAPAGSGPEEWRHTRSHACSGPVASFTVHGAEDRTRPVEGGNLYPRTRSQGELGHLDVSYSFAASSQHRAVLNGCGAGTVGPGFFRAS